MIRLIAILSFFSSTQLVGQDFFSRILKDRYFSLSAGIGSASYYGDITSKIQTNLSAFNLGCEARLLSHFSTRIETYRYELEGKDQWAEFGSQEMQRNHAFASGNWEGNLQVLYYFKPYAGNFHNRPKKDPYIGLGIGFTTYNPYREIHTEKYFLRELATEVNKKNYGYLTAIIPATAGIKFKISHFTNLNFELGYRLATTDYLDDVSGLYPDPDNNPDNLVLNDLANPKDLIKTVNTSAYNSLVAGAKRGNDSRFDSYLYIMVKAEIYLPNGLFR